MKRLRDRKGRFASRAAKRLSFIEKLLLAGMLLQIVGIILYDQYTILVEHSKIVYAAEDKVELIEPRTVLIEVEIDWDENRVIEEIEKVFPDEPLMVDVARCESSFNPKAFNPTNTSNDQGIMQISEKYHHVHYQRLGLDMMDVQDNLKFARILYDEYGLQPWQASKKCWLK